MSMTRVTCSEIRESPPNELEDKLCRLQEELNTLQLNKNKSFNKIQNIRKSIANIHIVENQTRKDNLREFYHGKKYKPKDLRPKQTRAMRRLLKPKDESISLAKTQRKNCSFPQRTFAVKEHIPMPKKKQISLQGSTPGKFIPRDEPPSTTGPRSGSHSNRFNAKMVELLASSESSSIKMNNENEPILSSPINAPENQPVSSESMNVDPSHASSKVFHRRIVTMLETLKRRGDADTSDLALSKTLPSCDESKPQPITFGQLRQAVISKQTSSSTLHDENAPSKISSTRSYSDLASVDNPLKNKTYHTSVKSLVVNAHSEPKSLPSLSVSMSALSSKHHDNNEQLDYSSFVQQSLQQNNVAPRLIQAEERRPGDQRSKSKAKLPLTVDEILATYYPQYSVPTNVEKQPVTRSYKTLDYRVNSTTLRGNPMRTDQSFIPTTIHPRVLNESNKNRPPPPSYSSSVANNHQSLMTGSGIAQNLIRPPVPSSVTQQIYRDSSIVPQLPLAVPLVNQVPSPFSLPMHTPIRPPPPCYEMPTSTIERSHSAVSSMHRPSYSQTNPSQAGFDREFSRLLYGKEAKRSHQQKSKRKSFSDPVKKSVEEAGQSIEKSRYRAQAPLTTNDTVNEEDKTTTGLDKRKRNSPQLPPNVQKRSQAEQDNLRKNSIVPPNPILKQPIPPFLRVYSQTAPANDILLQWHLFNLSELIVFDAMMTKLYKDENMIRVQLYECYRIMLMSVLETKKMSNKVDDNSNDGDDGNAITTTAL